LLRKGWGSNSVHYLPLSRANVEDVDQFPAIRSRSGCVSVSPAAKENQMTQLKTTGPAQPDQVEHPQQAPDAGKTDNKTTEAKKEEDQPGADGFSSARADEDTFD
jgi:hypothetical protein